MHKLYLFLRAINVGLPCILLMLFISAFVLAFALMFFYPLGSLILVFLGLGGLWGSAIVRKLADIGQLRLAKSMLRQGLCPNCGNSRSDNIELSCEDCEARFDSRGIMIGEVEPSPRMKSSIPDI